jgi:hypothetical protein
LNESDLKSKDVQTDTDANGNNILDADVQAVVIPVEKECPECCKIVPLKAKRCCFCTSLIV